jgi:hypothetical protein
LNRAGAGPTIALWKRASRGSRSDLKPILARIEAVLPHLATAAQVAELKGDLERKFAEFTGTIELKQAEFAGSMDSKLAQFAGSIDFKLAQFAGSMDYKLAQFANSMDFKHAQFAGSMESRQAQFAGDFNAKLERLTGRVESLPTTWQMITATRRTDHLRRRALCRGVRCGPTDGTPLVYGHQTPTAVTNVATLIA